MGAFRDPSTINNVGAVGSTTNPLTGSALGMDRENQKAIKELIGTLDWESLSILDGGITPVSSEIIVDTEDGTPADDLTTINLTSDGTTSLHTGMRIKIKSADPSRVITVKHLTGGGNIRTADGQDVVLSNDWSLDLKLQNGEWVEQKGRGYKIALDVLARTNPATTTSRGIARVATLADMEPGATVENGPAFPDVQGGVITPTPTAHAVPQADADGKLDDWVSLAGKANLDMDNISTAGKTAIVKACMPGNTTVNISLGGGYNTSYYWQNTYADGDVSIGFRCNLDTVWAAFMNVCNTPGGPSRTVSGGTYPAAVGADVWLTLRVKKGDYIEYFMYGSYPFAAFFTYVDGES